MKILGELWVNDVTRTLKRAKRDGKDVSETELQGMERLAGKYGVVSEVAALIQDYYAS